MCWKGKGAAQRHRRSRCVPRAGLVDCIVIPPAHYVLRRTGRANDRHEDVPPRRQRRSGQQCVRCRHQWEIRVGNQEQRALFERVLTCVAPGGQCRRGQGQKAACFRQRRDPRDTLARIRTRARLHGNSSRLTIGALIEGVYDAAPPARGGTIESCVVRRIRVGERTDERIEQSRHASSRMQRTLPGEITRDLNETGKTYAESAGADATATRSSCDVEVVRPRLEAAVARTYAN